MAFERLSPGNVEWDAYFANHIFRYQFAGEQLKRLNKTKVLDAACGVGFGSQFLASDGMESVVAVDRNEEALAIAAKNFSHPNIVYLTDDCHVLDNARRYGPFPAIVSFETLEHLPDPKAFLKQCYSLLEPGGVMILSTPNSNVSSPDGHVEWEFHEKEYTPEELEELLQEAGFSQITLYGQGLTPTGVFRQDIRAELNKINSNPFLRLGRLLQRILKGHRHPATLPEKITDFEITPKESFGSNPPFVTIAVTIR
jgi:SAM-dependent methyltransferase